MFVAAVSWLTGATATTQTPPVDRAQLVYVSDNGDGTYRNPVIFADYSDPDVVRVGDDFYLVSSSFGSVPGLPILYSRDLVNWTIVGHAAPRLPSPRYDVARDGQGLWAPSLRYHGGEFWIYVGDPDLGIFMTKARDPRGPWDPLVLVKEAKGWIDPCPFWDDDGQAYLVHAWAKSRAGFNSIITVNRLSSDGLRVGDEGVTVFDGHARHPTIEGPKFYKRSGYYYVFAPAGGVSGGWQTVLRSRHVLGPYEDRVVLEQGTTTINGPHQGAWVDTPGGESWFVHFQDRGPYGRVVHLQPMAWNGDWPVIGVDRHGDGRGEPVLTFRKPRVVVMPSLTAPQTSDEFGGDNPIGAESRDSAKPQSRGVAVDERQLGAQWQWTANPAPAWWSLSAAPGNLRLFATAPHESGTGPIDRGVRGAPDATVRHTLWNAPNLLLQKFPAESFTATTLVDARGGDGTRAGLIVMGSDYAAIAITRVPAGWRLERVESRDADKGGGETIRVSAPLPSGRVHLRAQVGAGALVRFSFSADGMSFTPLGEPFPARGGNWVGARIGVFATRVDATARGEGHADFDWFRVIPSARAVRVVLVGDSTVTDEIGWGRGFKAHLDDAIECVNVARNGRSSRSYLAEGLWAKALAERPDFVLIQFGHNDEPGKGPERETDAATTYREFMGRYVDEARAAGATPIIVTSLTRRIFDGSGELKSNLDAYVDAAKAVAQAKGVAVIDLHARSVKTVSAMGATRAATLGPPKPDGTRDTTHLNDEGSALFGTQVADDFRRLVPALAPFIK